MRPVLCSLRRGRPGILATLVLLAGCDREPTTTSTTPAPSALPSAVVALPASEPAASVATVNSAREPAPDPSEVTPGCREQAPQPFLIRGNYRPSNGEPGDNARSIRYRAKTYGDVPGLTTGLAALPAELDMHSEVVFGHAARLHRKIMPALRCVEREIARTCKEPYRVESLAGWRGHNTFHQGEISNHMFGIALDIDPEKNPCCHCVEPWNTHPRCADRRASAYEHAALPRCWIDTFERFGFYWLGHDELEDTMHFEFLGDPDLFPRPPGLADRSSPPARRAAR